MSEKRISDMFQENVFLEELAQKLADFHDLHLRTLLEKNNIPFPITPEELEAKGYKLIREDKNIGQDHKIYLCKIIDIDQYKIKFRIGD